MTYDAWIKLVEEMLQGYNEGRYLSSEVFSRVMSLGDSVTEPQEAKLTDCPACLEPWNCECTCQTCKGAREKFYEPNPRYNPVQGG